MKEFSKKIKINDYENIQYDIGSAVEPVHIITFSDTKDGNHTINFIKRYDYCFISKTNQSFDEYKKSRIESYTFDKNQPLYLPLLHLLNGDDDLIIDDDETLEFYKKYLRIYINNDNINVDFINNLEKDPSHKKFNVYIRGTGYDIRSKVNYTKNYIKERLHLFFKEVYERINEENHQITIEEYLIDNNLLTRDEAKKYTKKLTYNKRSEFI